MFCNGWVKVQTEENAAVEPQESMKQKIPINLNELKPYSKEEQQISPQ